jgi:hypothetical protein
MNETAAKVWLLSNGGTRIEYNYSIPDKTMNRLEKSIKIIHKSICEKWEAYFEQISFIDEENN